MPDKSSPTDSPLYWPIERLTAAYRSRELSPVEVLNEACARADAFGDVMNVYITRMDDLAMTQARAAEAAWRDGSAGALCGVPVAIKDAFEVDGYQTTNGSLHYVGNISTRDSDTVARLRAAGAVLTGKTNTAEFGQSATTDNLLGPETTNAWDTTRTSGGSSGGSVSAVAAGLASLALGSDGGGSVRIPASFSGVVGIKPTYGLVNETAGCKAMSEFVCPGTFGHDVDGARRMLAVLSGTDLSRQDNGRMKIGVCRTMEDRPVDPGVAAAFEATLGVLEGLGHDLIDLDLPVSGWKDIFGPLVLIEELQERGHFFDADPASLTDYEQDTIRAAKRVRPDQLEAAHAGLTEFQARFDALMTQYDALVIPTTATPAFKAGTRPELVDGRPVSAVWGAVPFTACFNVSGMPGLSLPCGLTEGLPVGFQILMGRGRDAALLSLGEDLEQAIGFDTSDLRKRWALPKVTDA